MNGGEVPGLYPRMDDLCLEQMHFSWLRGFSARFKDVTVVFRRAFRGAAGHFRGHFKGILISLKPL